MTDRKQAPQVFDAVDLNLQLQPYQTFQLDNGVPVYAIDAGAQDVMMVELVFYAGNWFEQKNIVAATTNFLLKNGTANKSAFAINEHFELYGAYLNRSCYNETATITLHTLSKHLDKLLPVVAEILHESIFPEEELAIYKQNQKQKLEVNLKKCDFVANRLIDEYVYGFDHPYGRYTSVADYNALQQDEVKAFYKQYYQNGKCLVFVAGKLPANVEQQLNHALGSLPLGKADITAPQPLGIQPAQARQYRITNDEQGVQGAIRLARGFPNRHHEDFPKAMVLNNIFGGFFGSRLMSNIREDKGYTYGIHSFIQNHLAETAWVISTEAGRGVCEATIAEVYKEMKILQEELVDDEELDLVRNFMMGSLLADLDGPFSTISRWKNYILNGLDESYFRKSIHIIKTITADELRELARKYLTQEAFYELVVV
jgi:predicted Zn-dependent peptidase